MRTRVMNMLKKKSVMGGLLVLVTGGFGLWYYLSNKNQALYQTAQVERGTVRASISATGNCNAVVTVQVGSQVSGNIKALYADFNTKVKKGQLVAVMHPPASQPLGDQTTDTPD